jgi:hypothetical protein
MRHGCNFIHPTASPYQNTMRWILKTKGVAEQAEKVSVETSGERTEGRRS